MKAKVSLKTVIVSALLLVCGLNASADNKSNLIYNSEEVNGMKVAETVYKMDGNTLANYMKYNYKYDDQNRMTESEALKWNSTKNSMGQGHVHPLCIPRQDDDYHILQMEQQERRIHTGSRDDSNHGQP